MTLPPRLVIAAPASGQGKTTVATGLMAAWAARGRRVAPFKVGPDYIDPGYHAVATGRPGRNLDAYLCGAELIAPLVAYGARGADVAVVEGVMGLFDGAAGLGELASTAQVARLIEAPVVLVVDARSQGRSVAALVRGFAEFDRSIRVAGVILNRVGSDRHERILREALTDGPPVLGVLRRDPALAVPSRHLGLIPAAEHHPEARTAVDALSEAVAAGCDLDALDAVARTAPPLRVDPFDPAASLSPRAPGARGGGRGQGGTPPGTRPESREALPCAPGASPASRASATPGAHGEGREPGGAPPGAWPGGGGALPGAPAASVPPSPGAAGEGRERGGVSWARDGARGRPVIAVAGGPAFTFGYVEHAELLAGAGADVVTFDPVRDEALPEGTRAVVIGGGFPETHLAELTANEALRGEIASAAARGVPVVAECAGLAYLARSLDGAPMCGVLDATATMTDRLTLGYRDARTATASVLAPPGAPVRGHEFHRTAIDPPATESPAWTWHDDTTPVREGFVHRNVHASYLHTHWAAHPEFAHRLVRTCA